MRGIRIRPRFERIHDCFCELRKSLELLLELDGQCGALLECQRETLESNWCVSIILDVAQFEPEVLSIGEPQRMITADQLSAALDDLSRNEVSKTVHTSAHAIAR